MTQNSLSVLMISVDPKLASPETAGDVLERHMRYAEGVSSLDIIVFGGTAQTATNITGHLTLHTTGARGIANLWKAKKIARHIVSQKKIDLTVAQDPHATGFIAYGIQKRYRVPFIVHFHGDFLNNVHWRRERWEHLVKAWYQRRIIRKAEGIRVVSSGIREKLIGLGVPEAKIVVIPTPVSDVFSQLTDEQKKSVEKLKYKYEGKFHVLFCGRLVTAKNLLFMLDVIDILRKRQPQVQLFIVGDGALRHDLEEYVVFKKLESHVILVGDKPHTELNIYYHFADVLLLLSTNESFGKVIVEAGLSGTPCLASETAGARDIVVDGTSGILVPINDLRSTVDILNEMIEYPVQTKFLGERAHELYRERFSSQRSIDNIINFWHSIARQ